MRNQDQRIEGYWYSPYCEIKYPMPIPNVLSQEEANKVYHLILKKQSQAREIAYKGSSVSRIDGKTWVGSTEFFTKDWIWPNGFAEHYVRQHRVKPSDDFLKYIGYLK